MKDTHEAGQKFKQLVKLMEILRGEEGCPWDREQDEKSITNYFLEEVYEAVEAVSAGDVKSLKEELGDVVMEVVFLARIFEEKQAFSISDVLDGIKSKMIRRHPHVFGPQKFRSPQKIRDEWNRQKKEEKSRDSFFESPAASTPALFAAFQIGNQASSFGFDWSGPLDALRKVKEEVSELEKAIKSQKAAEIFSEIGDLLFSLVNISRHLRINPELALRRANEKFTSRIQFIEKKLRERGKELGQVQLEEMDRIWEKAKAKAK